jgi:hypothetical protein
MAKAQKQSKAQSKSKSSSKSSKGSRSAKSGSSKGASAKSSRGEDSRQQAGQADQGVAQASFQKAKEFVGSNANLPTAGLALAGAGVLALVSTAAGRNLVKAAAEAVISLVNLPVLKESLPDVVTKQFSSNEQPMGSKTDFAPAKRGQGKQNQKSTKAQI